LISKIKAPDSVSFQIDAPTMKIYEERHRGEVVHVLVVRLLMVVVAVVLVALELLIGHPIVEEEARENVLVVQRLLWHF